MSTEASPNRAIPRLRWPPVRLVRALVGDLNGSRAWIWRYLVAFAAVAVALLFREQLLPHAGDKSPFQTFVIAVLATALIGGLGPGLLATALGAALATYYFLPPSHAIVLASTSDAVRLLLFMVEGILAAVIGETARRAIARERTVTLGAERFRRFLADAAAAEGLRSAEDQPLVEPLSERELEVVRLLALGLRNEEIAGRLFVSRNTVKTHLVHVYGKLGASSRLEAVSRAIELGLLANPTEAETSTKGGRHSEGRKRRRNGE